jgi:hypothetical protein
MMKRTWVTSITLAVVVLMATANFANAQTGSAAAGAVPRAADGHPDLSGVWWRGSDLTIAPLAAPGTTTAARVSTPTSGPRAPASFTSLYQPWAVEKRATLSDKDDPTLRCTPVAFGTLNVSLFCVGAVGQIVQTPKSVIFLMETFQGFRIIPTDGRGHRDDVPPSYRGDSVGPWEGDTLVVDQTNFSEDTWMFAEGNVSFHSDELHIVERYRRTDANTLEVEATITDPKVLTGPWVVPKQTLKLAPFDQIMELGCNSSESENLMKAAAKENYGKK